MLALKMIPHSQKATFVNQAQKYFATFWEVIRYSLVTLIITRGQAQIEEVC